MLSIGNQVTQTATTTTATTTTVTEIQNTTSSTTASITTAVQNTTSTVEAVQNTITTTAEDVQNTTSTVQNTTTVTPIIEQNVTMLQNNVTEDSYTINPPDNIINEITGLVNSTLDTDAVTGLVNSTLDTDAVTGLVNSTLNLDIANLLNNTLNIEQGLLKPFKISLKNVDTKIFKLLNSTDPQGQAAASGLDYYDGNVRLDVELADHDSTLLSKIGALAHIELIKGNRLQITIPVDNIMELASLPEVKNIQPPQVNVPNKDILVNGQLFEDSVFTQNVVQNNPVSIAVIDLAFDVKSSKIVNNVEESVSFRKVFGQTDPIRGTANEYAHGTAMSEIITSVAPNAKLYLLTASNELEFLDAVDYAISKKVSVLTISSTWINRDTDEKSAVTAKVEEAISAGITVIMPSGNYAENHWEGYFADQDNDSWNNFTPSDEGMTIDVSDERISEKKPIVAYLRWENSQNAPDFDLTLSDAQGNIVDYSSNMQDSSGGDAVEYIYFVPNHAGAYHLGITCFSICSDNKLEIFSAYDKLEYFVPGGSVGVPSDAYGAIVVGASGDSNEPKSYSSVGPTDNGLIVPNFLAPDGIITTTYGGKPFFGTSSSTAYVTGLMALLFSEHPGLQPQLAKQTLINDLSGFGGKISTVQTVPILNQTEAVQIVVPVNQTQSSQSVNPAEAPQVIPALAPDANQPVMTETSPPAEAPATETQPTATESENQQSDASPNPVSEQYKSSATPDNTESAPIPHWYKTVVSWWHEKKISSAEFRDSVNYMLRRSN